MNCLHPTIAWRCGDVICKRDGVKSVNMVFSPKKALAYFRRKVHADLFCPEFGLDVLAHKLMEENRIELPCNHCINCQMQKRKDMSVRLAHEASQHEDCCFITLTYNDDNVPTVDCLFGYDGVCRPRYRRVKTLCPSDVQKFIKRLRRHLEYLPVKSKGVRDHVARIRYFAVGEYGGRTHRPHYHIMIFGWRPSDAVLHGMRNGRPIYRSAQIEKLWKFGYSSWSEVSPYVAKYCARYVTKKFSRIGERLPKECVPEFVLQSTRDGAIGAKWFDKFGVDACKVGFCTLRVGDYIQKASICRYYWDRLRRVDLPTWLRCRDERIAFVQCHGVVRPSVEDCIRLADCNSERLRRELDTEFF